MYLQKDLLLQDNTAVHWDAEESESVELNHVYCMYIDGTSVLLAEIIYCCGYIQFDK